MSTQVIEAEKMMTLSSKKSDGLQSALFVMRQTKLSTMQ